MRRFDRGTQNEELFPMAGLLGMKWDKLKLTEQTIREQMEIFVFSPTSMQQVVVIWYTLSEKTTEPVLLMNCINACHRKHLQDHEI